MYINQVVNGLNLCVYFEKNDISILYKIKHQAIENSWNNNVVLINDTSKVSGKNISVFNGKITSVKIIKTQTDTWTTINGEVKTYDEIKDLKTKFYTDELAAKGLTYSEYYDEDDEDCVYQEDYHAHLSLATSLFNRTYIEKRESKTYELYEDITSDIVFQEYEDIPYDKYITITLPNGTKNIDLRKGLYILNTVGMYTDALKQFADRNNLKYESASHGQLGEYDKIDGSYISNIFGKNSLCQYKQYLSFEDAIKGKKEYLDWIRSKLAIILNKRVSPTSAKEIIEQLGYISNTISKSDVKVSGYDNYNSQKRKIQNLIDKITEECGYADIDL